MRRGVSSGGGQSSLGYLFSGGETPPPKDALSPPPPPPNDPTPVADNSKQIPAGIAGSHANTGNFLTDRPSTKVHSAPGGGSSLGYLFGGK
ncbi:Protein SPIRAL1-like 1 [Zostera marina]|uniref:Protein SPIRAL1-like 1 n=1 Tax=Zostera marina TaxID=29655 RepID=A0A0K9NJC3_ZOSMR|nr:Protein SPIRAL1-like 1 [Zostera marina]